MRLGDSFAEVVDTSQAVVDVAIEDADAGLLKSGEAVVVKLNPVTVPESGRVKVMALPVLLTWCPVVGLIKVRWPRVPASAGGARGEGPGVCA